MSKNLLDSFKDAFTIDRLFATEKLFDIYLEEFYSKKVSLIDIKESYNVKLICEDSFFIEEFSRIFSVKIESIDSDKFTINYSDKKLLPNSFWT